MRCADIRRKIVPAHQVFGFDLPFEHRFHFQQAAGVHGAELFTLGFLKKEKEKGSVNGIIVFFGDAITTAQRQE
jgi:hypothetical protein